MVNDYFTGNSRGFSGIYLPDPYMSTGDTIIATFSSDMQGTQNGFNVTFFAGHWTGGDDLKYF